MRGKLTFSCQAWANEKIVHSPLKIVKHRFLGQRGPDVRASMCQDRLSKNQKLGFKTRPTYLALLSKKELTHFQTRGLAGPRSRLFSERLRTWKTENVWKSIAYEINCYI